ncbi:MAG: heterodisulfide reductase [Chloroflexi bacterium]|nr:heterodisulfide reductase [Chloroflexota bacterium]
MPTEAPAKEAPITQAPEHKPKTFREEVWSIPGGEAIKLCIQCGTCAGSCLNANQMDYSPRKVIAMVRANMKTEVLKSNSMWYCVSCYMCSVRCPRDIHITDMMYVLKGLAVEEGHVWKRGRTSNLAKGIVESVNRYGRVFEVEMVINYFFRTRPWRLIGMTPLGFSLLKKGRMPLRPHPIKGRDELRKIVQAAGELEVKP